MNFLLELDHFLFFLGNAVWHFPFFDWFMPIITDFSRTAPFLLVGYLWLIFGSGGRHRALALALLVGVGLADITSSRVVKKSVGRRRPCCTEPAARLLIGCKGSKSFPSSHAANTAAAAAVIIAMRGLAGGAPFVAIAAMVGYSRLYVGVHFPLDILAGFLLGGFIGYAAGIFFRGRDSLTVTSPSPTDPPTTSIPERS